MPTRIEKTDDGQFVAIVETPGRQPQRYYGKDHSEVILKLGQAQENASRRILELRTSRGTPDPIHELPRFEGKSLTADQQFKIGQDLGDPAKATSAFDQLCEARFGAKPEQIRETLARAIDSSARETYRREGAAFMAEHPDYIATPNNEKAMLGYLEAHNIGVTARNFALAYDELKADGLLELKQDSTANQPLSTGNTSTANGEGESATSTTTRLRAALTGIPGGRAVATASTRRPGGQTDEEFLRAVHGMSQAEFDREILGNKEKSERLEKLLGPKPPRS